MSHDQDVPTLHEDGTEPTVWLEDGEINLNTSHDFLEGLQVEETELGVQVSHPGEREAGFDLTDFGSAKRFCAFLRDVGLDPYWDYYRVKRNEGRCIYTWSNSDLLVACRNNPITGTYSSPEARHPQKGYASYIALEGKYDAVASAFQAVDFYAESIEDRDRKKRSFI